MSVDLLSQAKSRITEHLELISSLFNRPVKLTLIVRDPKDSEVELILSDDTKDAVTACVERRMR